jgi:hypothetical protein
LAAPRHGFRQIEGDPVAIGIVAPQQPDGAAIAQAQQHGAGANAEGQLALAEDAGRQQHRQQDDKQDGFQRVGWLARVHGEHACDQQPIGSGQYCGLHGDTTEQVAQHQCCIASHGSSGRG